jgi:hypothetical protein
MKTSLLVAVVAAGAVLAVAGLAVASSAGANSYSSGAMSGTDGGMIGSGHGMTWGNMHQWGFGYQYQNASGPGECPMDYDWNHSYDFQHCS